jgi:hypothetical protein
MNRRLRTASSAMIVKLALSGVSVALSPVANAAVTCQDQEKQAGLGGGLYSYWGRCTGKPVGTTREYKYREVIGCPEPTGDPWRIYGPWQFDGSWSKVACPDYNRAVYHYVQMVYV